MRIHYPEGAYDIALEVARAGKRGLSELVDRLGEAPSLTIDIVLNNETDGANGSATPSPYNLIYLNIVAPDEVSELSGYRDWLYELVTHEMTHIVHIDTVNGLAYLGNLVLGRWFFPNGTQPRFMTEGLATYFETALSEGGRVNNSYFDMLLRGDILAGKPLRLDELSGSVQRWPQGTSAYLYGSYFMDYLSRHFGEDSLRRMSLDYSGRIVPFSVNLTAKRVFGATYDELYAGFLSELQARYTAQKQTIQDQGVVEGQALTCRGQEVSPVLISDTGVIYFVASPLFG